MCPISVSTSNLYLKNSQSDAKIWILLVGVNEYQDPNIPGLNYSAIDCQKLGETLKEATQVFPEKEIIIHHDFAPKKPLLKNVQASLKKIVDCAKATDIILFYFSGHGLLDSQSEETALCLADTNKNNLLETSLTIQKLLTMLNRCAAHHQLIWLDACHCGNMTLTGAKGETQEALAENPTEKLLEAFRQKAAKTKGFYALLSCDQGQKSWEFPDLGHGLFSYFLMRGLQGEAANKQGLIEADELYRYVYNQTLQYIEKINQQVRLINQKKRSKGEVNLYPEYSQQTPKRIVEGVGELILGVKSSSYSFKSQRSALIIDGLSENKTEFSLKEVLETEGAFSVEYQITANKTTAEVKEIIQKFIQSLILEKNSRPTPSRTTLIYLRGRIDCQSNNEYCLILNKEVLLPSAWIRQQLRNANLGQYILVLDTYGTGSIEEWLEELKLHTESGQCLIGVINPEEDLELFSQILPASLIRANSQAGLSVAQWLPNLDNNCSQLGVTLKTWLSGAQGLIEILPDKISITEEPNRNPNPQPVRGNFPKKTLIREIELILRKVNKNKHLKILFASLSTLGLFLILKGTVLNTQPSSNTEAKDEIINFNGQKIQRRLKQGDKTIVFNDPLIPNSSSSKIYFYQEYYFQGKEGEKIQIKMNSDEFDPYLELYAPNEQKIDANDDISPDNHNAKLEYTLHENGRFRIVASSSKPGEQGHFHIEANKY